MGCGGMPVRRTLMPVVEAVAIQEAKLEVQGSIEHSIALGSYQNWVVLSDAIQVLFGVWPKATCDRLGALSAPREIKFDPGGLVWHPSPKACGMLYGTAGLVIETAFLSPHAPRPCLPVWPRQALSGPCVAPRPPFHHPA